jgi:hypothetical protein
MIFGCCMGKFRKFSSIEVLPDGVWEILETKALNGLGNVVYIPLEILV